MALYLSRSNTLDCRVYWFGNKDCYNGNCNSPQSGDITNNRLSDMGPNGITMGQEWKTICDAHSASCTEVGCEEDSGNDLEDEPTEAPTTKQSKKSKK